jgi:AcrR family transcriptional regulator
MTSTTRGRPRGFDRGAALDIAVRWFWAHGYTATSVADLAGAMGIGMPSLYAAFGDKKALFREAVASYQATYGSPVFTSQPAGAPAREAVASMLRSAAREYTDPSHPAGCLIITAATNCTPAAADIQDELRAIRNANTLALSRLISEGVASGRVLPGTDPGVLARFYGAVLAGMSQQARDGASPEELLSIAATAMRAWPAPTAAGPDLAPRALPPQPVAPSERSGTGFGCSTRPGSNPCRVAATPSNNRGESGGMSRDLAKLDRRTRHNTRSHPLSSKSRSQEP